MDGDMLDIADKFVELRVVRGNGGFEQRLRIVIFLFVGADVCQPFSEARFIYFRNIKGGYRIPVSSEVHDTAWKVPYVDKHGDKERMGEKIAFGEIEIVIIIRCIKIEFCKPFGKHAVNMIEIFHVEIKR